MYKIFKRFSDIIFSIFGIIITGPIMLFTIIILYLTGEKKPVFNQLRVGKNKQLFRLYKLRTMNDNGANNSGPITFHNDDRITFFGKFLRWSKIDEFPQFFNVLNGDLSFVGPRPLMPETFYKYKKSTQEIITTIRPGISGAGSVIFRNESFILKTVSKDKQEDIYINNILPYKGQLEEWYIDNRSFIMDLKLLIFSVLVVVYSGVKGLNSFFKGLPISEDLKTHLNS
ncbi:sugar transferase [Flavobacteriaceae bacterium]|nr:sugar transferase [Flavobacteriaceae bacterium]